MGCNGSKICRFSVRPSTLVITASQHGSQLFPSWNVTSQPGLGEGCPFRARQLLLTPWPSPRSGICHIFSIPPWAAKRINSAVWHFFWSGKQDLVARDTICLPKSQGRFGVVNFKLKTQSFALQWLKRYYSPERSKWKSFFPAAFVSAFHLQPRNALLARIYGPHLPSLPPFYQQLYLAWKALDGGLADGDILSVKTYSVAHEMDDADASSSASSDSDCDVFQDAQRVSDSFSSSKREHVSDSSSDSSESSLAPAKKLGKVIQEQLASLVPQAEVMARAASTPLPGDADDNLYKLPDFPSNTPHIPVLPADFRTSMNIDSTDYPLTQKPPICKVVKAASQPSDFSMCLRKSTRPSPVVGTGQKSTSQSQSGGGTVYPS